VPNILAFPTAQVGLPRPQRDHSQGAELIVFPRTDIRVLRRLWSVPIAGPDGGAIGMLGEDGLAG
jgi:hypothetical protein